MILSTDTIIGIVGGTGDLGTGLAKSWAAAGFKVIIGSRSDERAKMVANDLGIGVTGDSNMGAATKASLIVIAVPFANHKSTLLEIKEAAKGKIVLDVVVPLVPPSVSRVQLPPEGSAAQIAQLILGNEVQVVSAFHNVGAAKLHLGGKVDCDVLVFSDNKDARDIVIELANTISNRGVDGGLLANSAAAEALTSVLIGINRRYKLTGAGIKITGFDSSA